MRKVLAFFYPLVSLFQKLEFDSSEMEEQFALRQQRFMVKAAVLWCALQAMLHLLFVFAGQFPSMVTGHWGGSLSHLVPVSVIALLLVTIFFRLIPKCHIPLALCGITLLIVGCSGFTAHLTVERAAQTVPLKMPDVWALVGDHPIAASQLNYYVRKTEGRQAFWLELILDLLTIDALRLTSFSRWALLLYFTPPLTFLITAFLSPAFVSDQIFPYLGPALISIYYLFSGLQRAQLYFREFKSDYQLRCSIHKEAEALRQAKEVEDIQKEASQRADSILNHVLKNIMADAAGCIELFLDESSNDPQGFLGQALGCLSQGMTWCKKRQAMLSLARGEYVPSNTPVELRSFCALLARHRPMQVDAPDATVGLDPILFDIVFSNAIHNAFSHGHPSDPNVFLSLKLTDEHSLVGLRQLKVRLTNRCNPDSPPLTADFVSQVLAGQYHQNHHNAPTLSDHIGLQHIYLAAAAHNMAVSLEQFDEVVVFQASFTVSVVTNVQSEAEDFHNSITSIQLFPDGLNIFCIDDSAVARRLLRNGLVMHARAIVHTYGETSSDVVRFTREALLSADIVILDQNLDFSDCVCLGTDILKDLLKQGYQGLACIRSANTDEKDRLLYQDAGAHCIIGKDISCREMMRQLKEAYARHKLSIPAAPQRAPLLVDGADSYEYPVRLLSPPSFSPAHSPHADLPLLPGSTITEPVLRDTKQFYGINLCNAIAGGF